MYYFISTKKLSLRALKKYPYNIYLLLVLLSLKLNHKVF